MALGSEVQPAAREACFPIPVSFPPSPTVIREDGWRQMLNLQDVQRSKLSLNPNQLNILLPF